jgi:hypothetical protein
MGFLRAFTKFTACLWVVAYVSTQAIAFEAPEGEVLLQVSGNIAMHNSDGNSVVFDRSMLQQLPRTLITTTTPWTDGVIGFEGVLLRDLMGALGAKGSKIHATAINDYTVTIPFEDFEKHNVIIAYKQDGQDMSVRKKGPLWIIYPWKDAPELKSELYHSRSIWQLNRITVE